jgi:hypothetical protein
VDGILSALKQAQMSEENFIEQVNEKNRGFAEERLDDGSLGSSGKGITTTGE